jgi:hypothetical protein
VSEAPAWQHCRIADAATNSLIDKTSLASFSVVEIEKVLEKFESPSKSNAWQTGAI